MLWGLFASSFLLLLLTALWISLSHGMACVWQVPTHGLLNVVAAPQLAVSSTYRALDPGLPRPTGKQVVLTCSKRE